MFTHILEDLFSGGNTNLGSPSCLAVYCHPGDIYQNRSRDDLATIIDKLKSDEAKCLGLTVSNYG